MNEVGKEHNHELSTPSLELQAFERSYKEGYLLGRWIRAEIELEELRSSSEALEEQANNDDLTGLMRRNIFADTIEQFYQKNQRAKDLERCHALLFMDVDDFGAINKTLGTLVGDECLRSVGDIITKSLQRSEDLACRWGGEEFVVLLPDTSQENAVVVAKRLQSNVNKIKPATMYGKVTDQLGITIGVTEYQHGTNFMNRFHAVDTAVSDSKKNHEHKNQIIVVSS